MKYAGFGKRFQAQIIDAAVFLPFVFVWYQSSKRSQVIFSVVYGTITLLGFCYTLFFHTRYGQTLGKMVAKVRVVRLDGSPIGFKEALLRDSVGIVLTLFSLAGYFINIFSVSPDVFASLTFAEKTNNFQMITLFPPIINRLLAIFKALWGWAELITLLTNEKKRAVHDFIAGTVVIEVEESNFIERMVKK